MHSNPSHAETLYYKALGQPTTIPNLKNNLREALSDDIPVSPLCFLKVVYTSHDAKRFALDMSLKKLALDLLQIRELAVACKTTNANKEFMGLVNEKIKQIAAHVLQVRKFYLV
uniref:Uncharacterized protein n=1 Tax=Panagrolaimus superbus TaxID=310955 RepID=A0A914YES7_9BILA